MKPSDINPHNYPLTPEQEANMKVLASGVTVVENTIGAAFQVTSGLRSWSDHKAIYDKVNSKRKQRGLDPIAVPQKSKHLIGAAVDVYDPTGDLKEFLRRNPHVLDMANLWCEDFSSTPNWVHFQCLPYGSWTPNKARTFFP